MASIEVTKLSLQGLIKERDHLCKRIVLIKKAIRVLQEVCKHNWELDDINHHNGSKEHLCVNCEVKRHGGKIHYE